MATEIRLFSDEEIRMLARNEAAMDAGEQPFAVLGGERIALDAATLANFDLRQGQTINAVIFEAIVRYESRRCEEEIDLQGKVS